MTIKGFARTTLVAALLCLPAFQAAAAGTDTKLLDAARAQQPAVIQSLHDMVTIESGSDDTAGLAQMTQYCEDRLRALGAATRLIPSADGKPTHLVEGVFKGNGKLRVMLIAHMDTVYRKGILASEPYHRDGNKLYGPGIADDKGGVAVILNSLAILKQLGWHDYATLTVLFNPDEEIGSPGSGDIIQKLGSENDVVLSYEPSPAKAIANSEGVLLQAAGTGRASITVQGRASHAGAAPEEGRNALIELAYQVLQTRDTTQSIPGVQMNWTTFNAGTVRNQIPDHAEAGADVRFSNAGGTDKLLAALKAKVAGHSLVPDTTTVVSLDIMRPMYKADERTMTLARLAQSVYAELHDGNLAEENSRDVPGGDMAFNGRNLLLVPGTSGGTDAGFAQSSGKAAVLEGLGLAGWGYHAKNEYIEVDSIVPRLYLTSRMLMELGKTVDADGTF
ncbi:MAG: Glutamate carboxypeptidase [Rhodanobacteraceae bacterium]|jgi:glutamate carboxypeptidase|nr:MAG: Glutamate carboxypeptidase [Rhodanobacteraceae bacterium]